MIFGPPLGLGLAFNAFHSSAVGAQEAAFNYQGADRSDFLNILASRAALRDGTGKEVKHPKSFIEELQADTNEWLGDSWN